MIAAELNGEFRIVIPEHRAKRPEWYTQRGWERVRLSSMNANLHAGDTIYYIGAEEGEMPALCQMWGAKVVLFEPNPKVWSSIRAIWEANGLQKPLAIFPGFASDITKKAKDYSQYINILERDSATGWPMCANEEMEEAHGFKELDKEADTFDQITIDDFYEQCKIVPTAISLDVEGAEGKVLRGAEKVISQFHPKIWLSGHPEIMHENYGEYLHELRVWIRKIGYKETILDYDHEVHLFYS